MNIDQQLVTDAIVGLDIGGPAKEEAARLIEGWLEHLDTFPETKWKCLFVETPFYIQLEPKTYVVGQMDAGFQDEQGVVLGEWKSRRAPKLKKDGTAWAGDDEDGWLADISNGPQLGVYALAGREGIFIHQDGHKFTFRVPVPEMAPVIPFNMSEPRILVRAAVKSNPVVTWPGDYKKGLFTFPGPLLDSVRSALLSEAASIRARRQRGVVPFMLPGTHCTNMYHRLCEHYKLCTERLTPPLEPKGWHPTDPGFEVARRLLGLDFLDPELVVLSASSLESWYWCAEKGRIDYDGHGPREESFELSVGTGLHKGLASIYSQWASK